MALRPKVSDEQAKRLEKGLERKFTFSGAESLTLYFRFGSRLSFRSYGNDAEARKKALTIWRQMKKEGLESRVQQLHPENLHPPKRPSHSSG
jgi:hypothetical protein